MCNLFDYKPILTFRICNSVDVCWYTLTAFILRISIYITSRYELPSPNKMLQVLNYNSTILLLFAVRFIIVFFGVVGENWASRDT